MGRYIVRRLLLLIPIVLAVTFISFALMQLAGSDAVEEVLSNTGTVVSQETLDARRAELGLDRPFLVQYFSWLFGMFTGDMGVSYVSGHDVFQTFVSKLPATLLLMTLAVLVTIIISVPLGILSAVKQNKVTDYIIRVCCFIGNSLPNFFIALLLIYVFAVVLGVLPVISTSGGSITPQGVVLPTLTLAIAMSAKYTRQIRAVVLEELGKGYVEGAEARGIPQHTILTKNVLKCSMFMIITLLALSIGDLLGGTAIVETIFMWDGVGKLAVDSIMMRDYPMILAYVAWMAIIYVVINLIADIIYQRFDPRLRLGVEAS